MPSFFLGIALIHGTLLAACLVVNNGWAFRDMSHARLVTVILVAPLMGALAVTEVINILRPRRAFDPRIRERISCFILGVISATMAVAASSLALAFLDLIAPEALITAGTSALSTGEAVLLMRRHKPGHCVLCGYDLQGLGGRAICPECGGMHTE